MAAAAPPNSALSLSIEDENRWDAKNEAEEEKCAFLVVALCPCLVCLCLVLIVVFIVLIVKFHFLCHTPLHSLMFKSKC